MELQHITISNKRTELVTIARAMLDGRLHLIEGTRRICALRHVVGQPENDVFAPFRAIESETDHFPCGEMRIHCAADYLQQMDTDMNRYLEEARQEILAACEEIIRVFS